MNRHETHLDEFEKWIAALEATAEGLGHAVAGAHEDRSLLAFQAEWHLRGLIYHLRRCHEHYSTFVGEVSARASTGASAIVMFAPSFQHMLFEFYALVNLARISLDNLRVYLRPLFVRSSHQLPKSIRDMLAGSSDCPVLVQLTDQPLLTYLVDLRNCLVHYRSFATRDNAIVRDENLREEILNEADGDPFLTAMARAEFRRVGPNAISVNVLLPDRIFEEKTSGGGDRLAQFTYRDRWNLLSMARGFVELTAGALIATMKLLMEINEPIFHFSAKSRTN